MKYDDRYASAIRSGNLSCDPKTAWSDTDVLGAAGLAARRQPLALALERLLAGDNRAAREIVELLAAKLDGKAHHMEVEITRVECVDAARAVLAWFRGGTCKACGGHGFRLVPGAPVKSTDHCRACKGVGKVPLEPQFAIERQPLVAWLVAEIERELAKAAPEAMKHLALEFDR